jgi:PPOX class probable F420-dependent enzyme
VIHCPQGRTSSDHFAGARPKSTLRKEILGFGSDPGLTGEIRESTFLKMSEKNPPSDAPRQFDTAKFLLLETFRKNGQPVRSPTFFAKIHDKLYISTTGNTGKVKRLRANSRVRVVPTDFRGKKILGEWIEGQAHPVSDPELIRQVNHLLDKQHPILRRLRALTEIFSRPRRLVYSIEFIAERTK